MTVDHVTLIFAAIGCLISLYNFCENKIQSHYEHKCLLESRFLNIRIEGGAIKSIGFRFCLTNISNKSYSLRAIYFKHPSINNGKKIAINQIGQIHFEFNRDKLEKKKSPSFSLKGTEEILPYLLKPNTKYEGIAWIDIDKKEYLISSTECERLQEMPVIIVFDFPQKYIVPIKYNEPIMRKNMDE